MLYQPHRFSERTPSMINLQMLLALGGGLLAAAQALLIVLQGNILCLNDGCEIVEKLTKVPPIAFNVVGSLFFMSVFLALWQGARGVRGWLNLARILLLAGMAVEGVLIGFQYYVAQVFCSYCLTVFSIILLLNLLMGWRQLLSGLTVTVSVLMAFSGLQFVPHLQAGEVALESGVYGRLENTQSSTARYLFFSSSCPHCEDVIATIDDDFVCSLDFNPVDELQKSPINSLTLRQTYSPELNRTFLKNLEMPEIPVLVVKAPEEVRVLKGKQAIVAYFDSNCRKKKVPEEVVSGLSGTSVQNGTSPVLPFITPAPADETCSVDVDCEEDPLAGTAEDATKAE